MRPRSRHRTTPRSGSYRDGNGFEDVRLRFAAMMNSSKDEVIPKRLDGVVLIWTIGRSRSRSVRVDEGLSTHGTRRADRFTARRWNPGRQQAVDGIAGQEVSFPRCLRETR